MRLYAGLWLAAACAYDQHKEVDARIRKALKKSLEPYPKGESKDDAIHYVRDVLSFPESAVLVYDHHVIVDRRFLRLDGHAAFQAIPSKSPPHQPEQMPRGRGPLG